MELDIKEYEPLAPRTTFSVGGPARWFVEVESLEGLAGALELANTKKWQVLLLGGGSNLLVGDAGFDGLVISFTDSSFEVLQDKPEYVVVKVGAGHDWDRLVARCVAQGWAGIECLSGIPGCVGAAPIQNIGAYGQEIAECIEAVHVMDRLSSEVKRLDAGACGFRYRHSHFKADWRGSYVVVGIELRLSKGAPSAIRYGELSRALEDTESPTLEQIREAVVALRRGKSMVYDTSDPNHRSAGSFFVNPIVPEASIASLKAELAKLGIDEATMPIYPVNEPGRSSGWVKLSAAWLIERAGFSRGLVDGEAGLSSAHCLALINRGGASASDIMRLARTIRAGVMETFGVELVPEPFMVGLDAL